ncbi:MAG: nitroreductase family protein [Deltaproteobacteria bacterium]|nr:nitroreductase family protein [Deltaproteobacteria bacterium]
MDYDGFLALVQARRSIRVFKSDPVPDEFVDRIIEAARFAPSGGNSQPWEFIVVKDRGTKDRIVGMVADQGEYTRKVELTREEDLRFPGIRGPAREPGFKNAPVFIVLCGDPRTKEAYPLMTVLTRGDSHYVSSLANGFFCMTLAATALGLGSQWVSATGNPFVSPLLKELLSIPQDLTVYDMMVLGYAAAQPKERFVRDRNEMVHHGRYDMAKYRDAREMREFILRLRKG